MKKKYIGITIFLLFFIYLPLLAQFQTGLIKHEIQKGDTFYNLGRKYNLSPEFIREANPDINQNNLEIGKILWIPLKENVSSNQYKKYTVKFGDTIYSLTKIFGKELEKINPELQKGLLLEGMSLNIPKSNLNNEKKLIEKELSITATEAVPLEEENEFSTYLVEKGDTVFSILQKNKIHEITFDKLLIYNPFLEKGIQKGMILKIPSKKHLSSKVLPTKEGINIMLMLPLFLDTKPDKQTQKKLVAQANSFYLGAKHAIEEIRKSKNINIYVKVFDTKNDKDRINHFLKNYNFSFIHAVIGPLFRSAIEQVAKHLKNDPIAIVSPFSASDLLDGYSNVLQAEVKEKYLIDSILEEIEKSTRKISKIYLLGPSWKEETLSYFKSKLPLFGKEAFWIKKISDFPTHEKDPFFAVFSGEDNHLVQLFINLVESFPKDQIFPLAIGYSNLYHKNREKLKKYNFIFSTKNYFNTEIENSEQKKSILKLKTLPCAFGVHKYLGYDLTYDLLSRLSINRRLLSNFPFYEYKGISRKINYGDKTFFKKAYINKGVWKVRFVEEER